MSCLFNNFFHVGYKSGAKSIDPFLARFPYTAPGSRELVE